MIQRIQSIYLLISFILITLMLFLPLVIIDEMVINASNKQTLAVTILVSLIALISLVTIFLYKKRNLQVRLCIYNMLLMVAVEGLLYYYVYKITKELDAIVQYQFAAILPLIALILTYLALRAIRRDDAIVKSLDRIR